MLCPHIAMLCVFSRLQKQWADVPKPLSWLSALTVLSLILQLDDQEAVWASSQQGDGIPGWHTVPHLHKPALNLCVPTLAFIFTYEPPRLLFRLF